MPSQLTDTHLADLTAPLAWRGVLRDLREFLAAEKEIREGSVAVDAAQLRELHDRVVAGSAELLEPAALAEIPEAEISRLLLRSVLSLMRLKQSVVADQPVLDTAGSRTLKLFEADFFGSSDAAQGLIRRTCEVLNISAETLSSEEQTLQVDLTDAARKQAIVRALRDAFGLWPESPALRFGIAQLFQAIYPGAPIAADEIEVVVTSTLIFFCLPLTKEADALTSERYQRLAEAEQQLVREFLQQLKKFTQERFATFPAFGFVDCDSIDKALVQRIATAAGVTPADVLEELPRLITMLPQAEIDKYLIHDVWGHGWQASMLRFDDLYEQMSHFAEPLDLDDYPGLTQCFVAQGAALNFDAARFRTFAIAEVSRRLPIALSAVLAEMLADVAEFKFLAEYPEHAAWLPSSSRLAAYPAMLDLTLVDIPFYFGQATKAFRLLEKPSRQTRLVEQLVARGADLAAAQQAASEAIACWREIEACYFQPELSWNETDAGLEVNCFTRVALNFVGLHRVLLTTYSELTAQSTGTLPLKSFRDLLVLAASVFFEADPQRNLWRVDEFMTLKFVPFCRLLAGRGTAPDTE
jgi:hypothetical protein